METNIAPQITKKTIPTRFGSLIILLAAVIGGSLIWWGSFSYEAPDLVGVVLLPGEKNIAIDSLEKYIALSPKEGESVTVDGVVFSTLFLERRIDDNLECISKPITINKEDVRYSRRFIKTCTVKDIRVVTGFDNIPSWSPAEGQDVYDISYGSFFEIYYKGNLVSFEGNKDSLVSYSGSDTRFDVQWIGDDAEYYMIDLGEIFIINKKIGKVEKVPQGYNGGLLETVARTSDGLYLIKESTGVLGQKNAFDLSVINSHTKKEKKYIVIDDRTSSDIKINSSITAVRVFEMLDDTYGKNTSGVIVRWNRSDIRELTGVDSGTFKSVGNSYARDKNHAYFLDENIKGADPITFQSISFVYSKDKDYVYERGHILENADPYTFQLVDGNNYVKDKTYVWDYDGKVTGANPANCTKENVVGCMRSSQ